ncbi:MAG: hypothetical protein O7F12_17475 [Nitrospirae bacterium]|nr:hypothetical protein [Nitrospirota bacterium]
MSITEAKWKANQAKVAFLTQFPGLLRNWESGVGLTLKTVTPLKANPAMVVLGFSDGSFLLTSSPTVEPRDVTDGLKVARSILEPFHQEAYQSLDQLTEVDQEAARNARLENILGAIQNNLEQIPELKQRILTLVKDWKS